MGLTKILTGMVKDFSVVTAAIGDVMTFDGTKWVGKPGVPSGSLIPFAGATAPSGWLMCDGRAVSRASYAGLFAVVGSAYGGGDGSLTFNLPDLRGRAAVGLDNLGGTAASRLTATAASTLGGTGGAESQAMSGSVTVSGSTGATTLSEAQIPSHTHTYSKETNFTGSGGFGGNASQVTPTATTAVGGSGSHTHSMSGTGTLSGSMNVTQPWLAINYIIKT